MISTTPTPKTATTVLTFPIFSSLPIELSSGRYLARLAATREDIEAALRLRFSVFNIELRRGLARSFANGMDVDEFDGSSAHVILVDRSLQQIIGTCRLQTATHWTEFYSARKFNLANLPAEVFMTGIEVGRLAVSAAHRNNSSIQLLKLFLSEYFKQKRIQFVFGCCSLNSQDPLEGGRLYETLQNEHYIHPSYRVTPRQGLKCFFYQSLKREPQRIPSLFRNYLKTGARVCGLPALDREFRTIDFFTVRQVTE